MNRVVKSIRMGVGSLITQVYFKATGGIAVIFLEIQELTMTVGVVVVEPFDTLTP